MVSKSQHICGQKRKQSVARVLVVDDHGDTADVLRRILQYHGYEVRSAIGYREALRHCTRWTPELLVGDIAMPGKDGYDLLKLLRQADPVLKAIAISGYATPNDARKAQDAGYDEFLAKPFNFETLVEAINRVLVGEPAPGQGNQQLIVDN